MAKGRRLALALILVVVAATSAHAFCFDEAGEEYGINPQILRAIAKVESNFDPAATHKNTNGTYDVGLMQINSGWASSLGKERWKRLGDACYNAKTGAWILAQCMNKYGYNWKAIGCYHSQTPEKRDRYARMVFDQLKKVAPLAQEAAYKPLKDNLAALVQTRIDGWVEDDVKEGKTRHSERTPPAVPVATAPSQELPAFDIPGLQGAAPEASFALPEEEQAEPGPTDHAAIAQPTP